VIEISDEIAGKATDALYHSRDAGLMMDAAALAVIRTVAPLIVATELRRLAGQGQGRGPFRKFEQELLLARADQLDPGST